LQARQASVQALLQQTPWAQDPLAHSVLPEQLAPSRLRPHEPGTPPWPHRFGGTHSASLEQAVKQRVVLQRYGAQARLLGRAQYPLASHRDGSVSRSVVQSSGAQTVPAAYKRQAPVPSQRPSVPHVAAVAS
jgi:hypothetical protein